MMTIWFMNHYATMQYRDQSGRHYWFSKELLTRGYKPVVFCASTYHDSKDSVNMGGQKYMEKRDDATNIPFVFVKTSPSVGNGIDRIKNMTDFFKNLFPAARAYAKSHGKPDVILASSVHPLTMVAGIRIAKKLGVPCICEVRDLWPEAIFAFGRAKQKSLLGKALVAGEHWIYRYADALIFTKEGDTDYLNEQGWTTGQGGDISLNKCHYINNGIDLNVYNERIRRNVLDDPDLQDSGKFNVIYAGIIRQVNNVGMILDCAKLLKDNQNFQFLIYGDGSQLSELRDRVKHEEIMNVKLKGFVDRRYIPYVLSRSSVNILNYSQNQFNWARGNSSNKLFEYMASEKPIISTAQMGYSIINRYHCGLELPSCTAEALAAAITTIYGMTKDEYQALGIDAAKAAKDFSFESLTDKLEMVINSVKK